VCLYGGVLKECIHLFKYNERLRLSRILSELMVDFIKTNRQIIDDVDIIVPVPLSAGRLWQRGYNQSEILARALAKELGLSFSNALVKTKSTRPQSELKRDRRLNNVRGVFGIRRGARIAGKTILLVDDVLTTGSTLNECARILLESGAGRIRALTLARGI
jgi:ComF family protein